MEATTLAAVLRLSDEKGAELEGGGAVAGPARKGAKHDLDHVGVLAELIITHAMNCTLGLISEYVNPPPTPRNSLTYHVIIAKNITHSGYKENTTLMSRH